MIKAYNIGTRADTKILMQIQVFHTDMSDSIRKIFKTISKQDLFGQSKYLRSIL